MTARRAIIAGGSIAGLSTALALRRHGWDVDVYERNATALAGRGAGIVTHDRLIAGLAALDIAPIEHGVLVARRRLYAASGACLGEIDYPQLNTSWEHVLQVLRRALPDANYHPGVAVTEAAMQGAGVDVMLSDGTGRRADLLVAADGVRSSLRARLLPETQLSYAGYIAWRGLVDARAMSPATHEALMSCFAFCLPPGEQMLGYPVAGETPETPRFNIVWYRRAGPTDLASLLMDRHGVRHQQSVPPPLLSPDVIAAMQADAARLLAPPFAEVVAKLYQPFFQPIYDLMSPTMVRGRVAFVGDAAFVARPHVGAGVTKAVEDAVALADSLVGTDLDTGLAAYDAARGVVGRRIVEHGRNLGLSLTDPARAPSAAEILRETASLAFLERAPS